MQLARRFDGKKFMWDGQAYSADEQAREAAQRYQEDGFKTELVAEEDQFYVFTRREVEEVVVEGNP